MQRILDRLILSELSEANDPFFLKMHQVQAILYFGSGGIFSDEFKLYYRKPAGGGAIDLDQLSDGVDFIRESMRSGRRILAVGPNGATIVMAYLLEMGMGFAMAQEMLSRETRLRPDLDLLQKHVNELERRSTVTLGHRA